MGLVPPGSVFGKRDEVALAMTAAAGATSVLSADVRVLGDEYVKLATVAAVDRVWAELEKRGSGSAEDPGPSRETRGGGRGGLTRSMPSTR